MPTSQDVVQASLNQPPDFMPCDLWASDLPLREAVRREGGAGFVDHIASYGRLAGGELYRLGLEANRDRPRLRTHDRIGQRVDQVEFNAAYHGVMDAAVSHGVAALSWQVDAPGAHLARAALSYLHYQAEPGTSCPLTMTHAAVPLLRAEPALREWAGKAVSGSYDPTDGPIGTKPGVTLGMGMTEKQGGSDVRANLSRATPLSGDGEYLLSGHKWFFSAPMSDGFLVLAQAPGGLTCFLMPRWRDDGVRNAFRLLRLKDKLGDWANASSEVEFDDAWVLRVGQEGGGVPTIIQMVMLTRLDCALGSAGLMRMALAQAFHHARHRVAFGQPLLGHALMRNVLADLALESEAATALAMRIAGAVDAAGRDPAQAALARVGTAIAKYWICRRAPAVVNEAQECLGGNGYIEESIMPRLYRQAPLNSIWEGSGNIQCLDVLRALSREPATVAAIADCLAPARGRDACFDAASDALLQMLSDPAALPQAGARLLVEQLALVLQAAVLLGAGNPVATAFCRSRLGGGRGLAAGTLPGDVDVEPILARVLPA